MCTECRLPLGSLPPHTVQTNVGADGIWQKETWKLGEVAFCPGTTTKNSSFDHVATEIFAGIFLIM